MADCPNIETCVFLKKYEDDDKLRELLSGFVKVYCKGERQKSCVRMLVKEKFGAEKVPENMMPNGFPIQGSCDGEWDPEVKKFVHDL